MIESEAVPRLGDWLPKVLVSPGMRPPAAWGVHPERASFVMEIAISESDATWLREAEQRGESAWIEAKIEFFTDDPSGKDPENSAI